jgi:peptide/nickel transport system substrate-binding protein
MTDQVTYVFHVRKDVRWQDVAPVEGRALTAHDLVFSYQRQRTQGWPNASLLQAMDRMEALDDYTLRFTLRYPDADFLLGLGDGHSKIVAREVVETYGDLKEAPVIGTGPWLWVSTQRDIGTFLKRNPGYFEQGIPKLDELRILVLRDEETRYAAFATRTVDAYLMRPGQLTRVSQEMTSAQIVRSRYGGGGVALVINSGKEPLGDRNVRRAVFKGLDPWSDLEAVWGGQGYVGLGLPAVRPDWLLSEAEMRGYFGDIIQARELLKQAGFSSSLVFELSLADYGEPYLEYGRHIQEALQRAGFDPKVRLVDPYELSTDVLPNRDFQVLLTPLPPAGIPNDYLLSILSSRGRWNVSGHADGTLDRLIEEQATEVDADKRAGLVRAIQVRLLEQAYMFVPVSNESVWAIWPRVKGFYPNGALSEYFFWAAVSVED